MWETQRDPDPIDELIPPPHRWWVRFAVGLVVVLTTGVGAVLWGFGFVYPKPDCCGGGSGGALMSLSEDRQAVRVTAYFFNSSGRDLLITDASADLPGATVTSIAIADEDHSPFPILHANPLPFTIAGTGSRRLLITFVPTTCQDDGKPWGTVTVGLDVINGWLPSSHRDYQLPNPVVGSEQSTLGVILPDGTTLTTPLAAACALLGRTS
jgi:hypothetical protein